MQPPPIPSNDATRVAVLRSIGVLDTPPEPDLDALTELAAQICQVPMALISLVDEDRQWFKAKIGIGDSETSRTVSMCAHAIVEPDKELFVVPDAREDQRFAGNPFVMGDPNIRFYAGSPLVTHDGWALGTLCVLDRKPRELTPAQVKAMATLRQHVVNALELRRMVESQKRIIADLEATRTALDQARKDAEAAGRAKADFLAAMSHEIRTPMNAVIGMTTLLRASPLSLEQRETVDTIRSSGELLLTVINDILDFSKIESGKLEFEKIPFEIENCVRTAVALLAPRAVEKNLPIVTEIAPGTPHTVTGDVTRVRQILVNLLSNAVKFTERGSITVRISGRALAGGKRELEFSVTDTGIGIPRDRLDRLFQHFSQADVSTTRRYGGTGLGLAIAKRLAELHGGRMWVLSEPDRGSSFHFTIVGDAAAEGSAAPFATPAMGRDEFDTSFAKRHPARVLVAEDNVVNQKVALRTLEKLGYAPTVVSNGREVVAALQREPSDVVLMDVEMPIMDGPTATREIRSTLPADRQPVIIAVTAHALVGAREQYLLAGMDGYLTKPLRVGELTGVLARLAEMRQKRAAGAS